jgi:hypothetical protein
MRYFMMAAPLLVEVLAGFEDGDRLRVVDLHGAGVELRRDRDDGFDGLDEDRDGRDDDERREGREQRFDRASVLRLNRSGALLRLPQSVLPCVTSLVRRSQLSSGETHSMPPRRSLSSLARLSPSKRG